MVVQKVDPCYPSDAYTERVEGTVLLYGVIGADGGVEDVTVVRASEERLAERAKDAFARSRFSPHARMGGPSPLMFWSKSLSASPSAFNCAHFSRVSFRAAELMQ